MCLRRLLNSYDYESSSTGSLVSNRNRFKRPIQRGSGHAISPNHGKQNSPPVTVSIHISLAVATHAARRLVNNCARPCIGTPLGLCCYGKTYVYESQLGWGAKCTGTVGSNSGWHGLWSYAVTLRAFTTAIHNGVIQMGYSGLQTAV